MGGSVLGRYALNLFIPKISGKFFEKAKTVDAEFLGKKLAEKGWKSHVFVLVYSLLPLPTMPLFVDAGMARLEPYHILPGFIVGKLISDSIAGILLLFAFVFVDWRTLIQGKKFALKFHVWK